MHNTSSGEQLLRIDSVSARLGLRKSAIYDLIRAGELGPPLKIGRASLWPASEIDRFIAERINSARKARVS